MASLKPGTLKKVVRALERSDDSGPSADEVKGYPRVRIEGLRLAPKSPRGSACAR